MAGLGTIARDDIHVQGVQAGRAMIARSAPADRDGDAAVEAVECLVPCDGACSDLRSLRAREAGFQQLLPGEFLPIVGNVRSFASRGGNEVRRDRPTGPLQPISPTPDLAASAEREESFDGRRRGHRPDVP